MKSDRGDDSIKALVGCLHRGFRHKLFYEFREGASVRKISREHSLTGRMVEQIIREHVAHNKPDHRQEEAG